MALLCAIATGSAANFTTAGTWGVVDSTSLLRSETGTHTITTAYSGTRTSAFTPGAIPVDGILLFLSVRTGTTGTLSAQIEKDSDDSQVAGTEVTINCSDLPAAATADVNGGAFILKFASPVTLAAATAYQVAVKTSSSNQIGLFRDSTPGNVARGLRTTTTQAPAAGDDLIIAKEWTAAATGTDSIVTLDNTATTIFGSNTTSTVTPALAICNGGTLICGTAASTAYLYKTRGHVIIYAGGTLSQGTSGARIPSTSSCTITLDVNGSNVDFGAICRNLGTWNQYGDNSRVVSTLMTADKAAGATVITVASTAGWQTGDVLAFASTSRTASECEKKTISTVDSATQVTLTAGLTNAHSGTSPTQAEVINLTRNVLIQGASDTLQAYINIGATATVNWSYAEVYRMGSATSGKRGIDVATTTGTFVADKCSFHEFVVASSIGINQTGTSGQTASTMAVTNCVFYAIANSHYVNAATSGAWNFSNNICIRNTDSAAIMINLIDLGGTLDGNTVVGSAYTQAAIDFNQSTGTLVSCNGLTSHSNSGFGLTITAGNVGTIQNISIYRNSSGGIRYFSYSATLSSGKIFGNASFNIIISAAGSCWQFNNITISGDSTFSTPYGIQPVVAAGLIIFNACTFGVASGIYVAHTSGDINNSIPSIGAVQLNNCMLASTTEVVHPANLVSPADYISSQRHDQTNGVHKTWVANGIVSTDTTFYRTTSPGLRMTPSNASAKMNSAPLGRGILIPVTSGVAKTIAVYIRKSAAGDGAAYNGNQPRLMIRRNDAVGITADTVLATYSAGTGSWNQISGATATPSDNGAVEVYVDCDGTAGWITLSDLTAT